MTVPNASLFPSLIHLIRSALIVLPVFHGSVRAENAIPEGGTRCIVQLSSM